MAKAAGVTPAEYVCALVASTSFGLVNEAKVTPHFVETCRWIEMLVEELVPGEVSSHIPNRMVMLDSNPAQWYCSNPDCYSHECEWGGWTDV